MTDLAFRLLVVMACTLMSLMLHAMVGLWLRQFDIPLGGADGALSLMASQSQDRPWRVAPPRSATLRRGAPPFSEDPVELAIETLASPPSGWRMPRASGRAGASSGEGAKSISTDGNRWGEDSPQSS